MDLQSVYSKTAEGAQEISTRHLHLDAMTRRLLIIVDGERSAEALMQFFKEGQDISVLFETLTQLGLIVRTGGPATQPAPDSAILPIPEPMKAVSKQSSGPSTTTVISELQTDAQPETQDELPAKTPTLSPASSAAKPESDHAELHRSASQRAALVRFNHAQTFMDTTARKVLGLKSTFFISKIERATNEDELTALLDQFQSELFEGTKDRGAAKQYRDKAESLLRK